MTQLLTRGMYLSDVDNNYQFVPYELSRETNTNFGPMVGLVQSSLYEDIYS